jgi:hypothetical protein
LDQPIFIVGGPRSGTTLLRNMLNRHPAIAICRETEFFHWVFARRRTFGDLGDTRNRRQVVTAYLATRRIHRMQVDLLALERTLLEEGSSYPALFLSLLNFFAQSRGRNRCGEKTPHNALVAEMLCQWYPGAKIIHLLRDPRDAVSSMLRMPWAPGNVRTNVGSWLQFNLAAWRLRSSPRYLLVRYEALVAQPENELGRICDFLGEEYSSSMLVPNWDPTADLPWFQRAEEPVTTGRLGRWREELSADRIALTEWYVGDHMRTFGYEVEGKPPSPAVILRDTASAAADAVKKRVEQFPAAWYYLIRSRNLVAEETARERYLAAIQRAEA